MLHLHLMFIRDTIHHATILHPKNLSLALDTIEDASIVDWDILLRDYLDDLL